MDTSINKEDYVDLINELELLNVDNIKKFTFKGLFTPIKIIKVIDGDTVKAIFKFKDEYYNYNFRMIGIDTAEIHSKDENEKKRGLDAKEYVYTILNNKIVIAEFLDFDKYGRILVNIYLDNNESLSDNLINGGYAQSYDGKTKSAWI
jgi:endonuclease YncB( thermonuclease family)